MKLNFGHMIKRILEIKYCIFLQTTKAIFDNSNCLCYTLRDYLLYHGITRGEHDGKNDSQKYYFRR